MANSMAIVGYGPGVAAAAARAFAAEGFRLALIARDGARLDAACRDLAAAGHEAQGFPADAGDEAALTTALTAAREAFGDPEVLLYNAAHWRPGPAMNLTADDLVADFRICTAGALTAARAVVPAMKAARRGSLLFTGGGFALHPSPQAPALSIGKAGIRALALMLNASLTCFSERTANLCQNRCLNRFECQHAGRFMKRVSTLAREKLADLISCKAFDLGRVTRGI